MYTPEQQKEIERWFTYHPVQAGQEARYQAIRDAGKQFAVTIMLNVPSSADRTAALRKIREAVMTSNAAISLE